MRIFWGPLIGTALTVLCGAGVAHADGLPQGGDLTCNGPFSGEETGQRMLARYGAQAKIMEVADITGESGDGLVLNPDDTRTRIETSDDNGNGTGRLTFFNIKQKDSLWTVEGLKLGMSPKDLTAANGGPLTLSGLEQVSETRFAISGWLPRGDCQVIAVFFAPAGVGFDSPLYNAEAISSDDPRLADLNLTIDELGLAFPEVDGD